MIHKKLILGLLALSALLVSCNNVFQLLAHKDDGNYVIVVGKDSLIVNFDKNGGETDASPRSIVIPKTAQVKTVGTLPQTEPGWSGYVFTGWNKDPVPDGGGRVFFDDTVVSARITVYAQWESVNPDEDAIVTFDKNGGDVEAYPQKGVVKDLPNKIPPPFRNPRWGTYNFSGWYEDADCTTEWDMDNSEVADPGAMTLYARWTATVTFDGNGNDDGTAPSPITEAKGTPIAIPGAGDLAKTGYNFDGWNTAADGSGDPYAEGDSYTDDADLLLYARWASYSYTVTFDENGGDLLPANPTTKTVNSPDTTIDALPDDPTDSTLTFTGWYTESDGTGDQFTAGTTVTGDITVYAKWE